ncbi:MAG TPA: aldehyde dehydrogenase family protein [Galbitalea sp.]
MTQATIAQDVSLNPRTGETNGHVAHSSFEEVDRVVLAAASCVRALADSSPVERHDWIYAITAALLEHSEELAQLADIETGLGMERLLGEIEKAVANARFYAEVAVDGAYLNASREQIADGTRLTRWNTPVGVVAVFGASNFPFAYGSFGHDAASAMSAGCPVIVKAHPAHPLLAARISELVTSALAASGAPDGAYNSVVGFDAGLQLVDSPQVKAVGFTGSQAGGMALVQRGALRGVPVFAEMGTVNPVVVAPDATDDLAAIAAGFLGSFTLGSGQYCTKPGLIFVPAGHGFGELVHGHLAELGSQTMLTRGIADVYLAKSKTMAAAAGIGIDVGMPGSQGFSVKPELIAVRTADLVPGSPLLEECFGPIALVCEYGDLSEVLDTLPRLQPSLAASVFTQSESAPDTIALVRVLLGQVGRVAVNAWPTGVLASWSQQHGGPWPATSRSDSTSVGAAALQRFLRPVTVQNMDGALLTDAFATQTSWSAPVRVDGFMHNPSQGD